MMASGFGSMENENMMYINTKFNEQGQKGFGLARVDKQQGEVVQKIVIGDREPIYDVDERNSLIFYKEGKKSLGIKPIH